MKPHIEIRFDKDGNCAIEGKNFKGADCEQATKYLEEALGTVKSSKRTPDYYRQNEQRTRQST